MIYTIPTIETLQPESSEFLQEAKTVCLDFLELMLVANEYYQKLLQTLQMLPPKLTDILDNYIQIILYSIKESIILIEEYLINSDICKDLSIEQKLYISRPLCLKKKRRYKPGGYVPLRTTKSSLVSLCLNTVTARFTVNPAVKRRGESCLGDNHINLYLKRLRVSHINKIQYQPNEGSLALAKMHI